MSANNWGYCPNCAKEVGDIDKKIQDSYGKVSVSEFQSMLKERDTLIKGQSNTLREDWGLGMHEGKFFVDYSAHCVQCDWSYNFTYSDKNPTEKKNDSLARSR